MSEYWVSHKKYFCKYCDIYITDDAPSRRQHEAGLRHKGNRERFVRNLYKQGERRKKDLEEEKREMARVEAAANAAFAQDVSAGHALFASSSSQKSDASSSTAASKKPERPASVWSNYTTAQSLGIIDPDEERLKAEMERRRTQGLVGEWEVVAPPPPPLPDDSQIPNEEESKHEVLADSLPQKREVEASPEDGRHFKLRKRTIGAGLGEIWDPGSVPIKLKSKTKEESAESSAPDHRDAENGNDTTPAGDFEPRQALQFEKQTQMMPRQNSIVEWPKWQPMRWKRAIEPADGKQMNTNEETGEQNIANYADPSIKKEDERIEFHQDSTSPRRLESDVGPKVEASDNEVSSAKPSIKVEETTTLATSDSTGGLFRKRKVPSGARGRRG
ncbi:hypothetical protein ACEPAF_7295 [Sanghuangporus sanghuang]|uniref:Matrin-type domain-containing protein n=1 Tax=Sanghuangporus baumii TaxID=108892 RepID=A0A9Q5I2N7_SANBA|nr:hypothetical protein A7U60_g2364 [Sanghuangporus baumii]